MSSPVEPNISSSSLEVPFSFEDLFFSRTDETGLIFSGNSVFQRISMYSWDELLRKPHNIIRHQDMPQAVFYLLWNTIKKKEPIGAYVKNKAKDGRYYWVFAIVTPVEGGYLSIRLKPSSHFFKVVMQEYHQLLHLEKTKKLKPQESAALLLARLAELGFKDYSVFQATLLSHEMKERDKHLNRHQNPMIVSFLELVNAAQEILNHVGSIFTAYEKNQYVPINLRVQAAQLGASGSTIGVISNNYDVISMEIKNGMNEFIESAERVFKNIYLGLFLSCVAYIQKEVLDFFKNESSTLPISKEEEMQYLNKQRFDYQHKANQSLNIISRQTENFHLICMEMKRLAAGLQVTRIMGKVESSRLPAEKSGLMELIADLENFQATISDGLRTIDRINRHIQTHIRQLVDFNEHQKSKDTNQDQEIANKITSAA